MLLARPRIQSDECLVSYLIRVSELNGFKHIGHLLHHGGLAWKNNRIPIHQIFTGEFELMPYLLALGLPKGISQIEKTFHSFRHVVDTPYFHVKYPKVCPDCIEEFGFCKFEWSFLPSLACVKHGKMLVDVHQSTGKRLSWYRQHLNKFDGDSDVIQTPEDIAPPAAIQISQYVDALLRGSNSNAFSPAILHGLELRESLTLIHFITHYQVRLLGDSFTPTAIKNNELTQCYQKVWEMLEDWPNAFYAFLSQYIDKPMSNKGAGGLNKHFRDLYESLHRQEKNNGVARIKVEFDRYIGKYWPSVLESKRITRIQLSSLERNIITKKEVATILCCRIARVDKLVQQNKLTLAVFEGKVHFQRNQVEKFAIDMKSNWTMDEACDALQLTRYRLKQLLDAGIFRALQRPDHLNRDWVIDKLQCQKLLENLHQKARKTHPPVGALSMAGIQRQGYSTVQLVLAMQVGKLEYGRNPDITHPFSCNQFIAFKLV